MGHVASMGEIKNASEILFGKPKDIRVYAGLRDKKYCANVNVRTRLIWPRVLRTDGYNVSAIITLSVP